MSFLSTETSRRRKIFFGRLWEMKRMRSSIGILRYSRGFWVTIFPLVRSVTGREPSWLRLLRILVPSRINGVWRMSTGQPRDCFLCTVRLKQPKNFGGLHPCSCWSKRQRIRMYGKHLLPDGKNSTEQCFQKKPMHPLG